MTELTLSAHPIYKAAVVSVQIEFLSTKKVLEEWKKAHATSKRSTHY